MLYNYDTCYYLDRLKNKPFWIWDEQQHVQLYKQTKGNCCIQHVLGLPIKNGKAFSLFEFQKLIFDAIEQNQNI
jgi:hypothetical protein